MLLFVLCVAFISAVSAICYYPDASTAPQDTPCLNSAGDTFCCGEGYVCLSNRICKSVAATNDPNSQSTYVRGSCTDPTWRSSACPSFCIDPRFGELGSLLSQKERQRDGDREESSVWLVNAYTQGWMNRQRRRRSRHKQMRQRPNRLLLLLRWLLRQLQLHLW